MVNYYDILKVSPKASKAELKSAYRRLARKLHPDKNNGSEETALKFAAIAEAYEILGNSRERAAYDRRILEQQFNGNGNADSVFASSNRHAQRWRQMVYEKRYNDIIDRMIEEERLETSAFQKVIYPLVALFVSAIIATAFRPQIFEKSGVIGKIAIVSLFAIGVIHLVGRIREGFERYTEYDDNIHDSILDYDTQKDFRYSQYAVGAGLLIGFLACLGIGFLIGTQVNIAANALPSMFAADFKPEFIFYPPIITLFVDLMHSFASRFEPDAQART
ncbi:MAG: J domain-containing protein [Pyrinomonadaceae bacterium]